MGLSPNAKRRLGDLRRSLWAQPAALALVGTAAGLALPRVEGRVEVLEGWASFAVAEAGTVITASATTVSALLAVGFSLATVTVQLAASQYTPRLLRRFMSDPATRRILGTFTGSLTYLIVLLGGVRAARGAGGQAPTLSVLLGLALAVLCVGLMPYFLHHVTRSIQVATIVSGIGKDTMATVRDLTLDGDLIERDDLPAEARVLAPLPGYLQAYEPAEVLAALPPGVQRARVDVAAGEFVLPGASIVSVWPAVPLDERAVRAILGAFAFSRERNLPQDVLFGVRQLVDLALRALSPGINDVTTAIMALNELGAVALEHARAGGPPVARWRVAHPRRPRLVVPTLSQEELVRTAFDEIVLAGREHPRVLARVLEILEHAAQHVPPGARGLYARAKARARELTRDGVQPGADPDAGHGGEPRTGHGSQVQ